MNPRSVAGTVSLLGLLLLGVMWALSRPALRQRSDESSPGAALPLGVPGATGRVGSPSPLKKVPVGGAAGYHVVLAPDGTGYLEGPDGARQPLPQPPVLPEAPALEKRVAAAVDSGKPSGPVKTENLYFLTQGVVAVPPGGIVTFVGKDHVVVLEDAGTVVYYADGRGKEIRERRAKP